MQLRPSAQSAVRTQDWPTWLLTGLASSSPQPTSSARAMLVAPIKDITKELRICFLQLLTRTRRQLARCERGGGFNPHVESSRTVVSERRCDSLRDELELNP